MVRLRVFLAGIVPLVTALLVMTAQPRLPAVEVTAPPPAGPTVQVSIDNFSFGPQTLTIKAGTTVVWTNRDDIPHTVAATGKEFKSKVLDTDDKFSFTFTTPGAYEYFCSLHPHMTGMIVVEAVTGDLPPP